MKLIPIKFYSLAALIVSSTVWGVSPLFYRELQHIDPLTIMAFRVIWSCLFLFIFLAFTRKLVGLFSLVKNYKTFILLVFSSVMIGINQLGFIYSISVKQVIQASFAYYIFPLIAVFFGAFFLNERYSKMQIIALLLAFVSVSFLAMGLGYVPYISLILGVTFGIYGLIKTILSLDPLQTVFLELSLISIIAVGYLGFLRMENSDNFLNITTQDFFLLIASGLITALPLYLFSYATLRLNYSTVGIINYLNPTLQFLIAVLVFAETFSNTHAISFFLIWISLFLYSLDSMGTTFFKSRKISSTESHTFNP